MRIACLQFAPQVGDVDNNLNRADSVLNRANPEDLDLLVLPELAFSGYNFKSLNDIAPFLEPTGAGITSLWARTIALKYNCVVAAGYPEKVDVSRKWPTSPEYYNSLILVNEDGETTANYRKTHLYYTDETWALENPDGFFRGHIDGLGTTVMGICMDLNPYRFEAPWSAYEFAFHILESRAKIVIVSMAWLTREDSREFSRMPNEPDMETVTYWIRRLEPLIRAETEEEIIVILANRSGIEGDAVYAGTSTVIGIKQGEVSVYGILGRGEKELLVVDTETEPFAKLVYRPEDAHNGSTVADNIEQSRSSLGVGIQRPLSGASSIFSGLSGSVEQNQFPSNVSIVSSNNGAKIYGGNVLITQDVATPSTTNFTATPLDDSPLSTKYSWVSPERQRIPPTSASFTTSNRDIASRTTQPTLENTYGQVTPQQRSGSQSEDLAEIAKQLHIRGSESTSKDPNRPSSPKSRNCSRTGRGERSDSVLAKRPPSGLANHRPESRRESDAGYRRHEEPPMRTASRDQGRPQDEQTHLRNASRDQGRPHNGTRMRNPSKDHGRPQQATQNGHAAHGRSSESPDMPKIDADIMVFEEGTRPRRDSLECHADEDDFIVMHSSKREQVVSPRTAKPKQTSGRESVGAKSTNNPHSTRNGSSTTPHQRPSKMSVSPPAQVPPKSHSAKIHSRSQGSPALPDSRNMSRGRTRHTPWSPREDSPTFGEHEFMKHGSRSDAIQKTDKHGLSASPSHREEHQPKSRRAANITRHSRDEGSSTTSRSVTASEGTRPHASRPHKSGHLDAISVVARESKTLPVTPDDAPKTPRAMILYEDAQDDASVAREAYKSTQNHDQTTLKWVERDADRNESDRPRSVLW